MPGADTLTSVGPSLGEQSKGWGGTSTALLDLQSSAADSAPPRHPHQ